MLKNRHFYLSSTRLCLGGKARNPILLAKGKSFLLQKDFVPIHLLLLEFFFSTCLSMSQWCFKQKQPKQLLKCNYDSDSPEVTDEWSESHGWEHCWGIWGRREEEIAQQEQNVEKAKQSSQEGLGWTSVLLLNLVQKSLFLKFWKPSRITTVVILFSSTKSCCPAWENSLDPKTS